MNVLHLLLVLAMFTAVSAAQVPRDRPFAVTGSSSLTGLAVTDDAAAKPLRRAVITLAGSALTPSRSTLTDEAGRFSFAGLPAGNVTVRVSKPGYVPIVYGQKRAGSGSGTVVSLVDGQTVAGIVVRVPHGGAITGTIRDETGAPRRALQVNIQTSRTINGERRLSLPPSSDPSQLARPLTDDRGVFRAYGLPPGDYVVSAALPPVPDLSPDADLRRPTADELSWARSLLGAAEFGPTRPLSAPQARVSPPAPAHGVRIGVAPIFYPGTVEPADAVVVTLGAGEERAGVDFAVSFVPTSRVEGRLLGQNGAPLSGVLITASRLPGSAGGAIGTRSSADGQFTLGNLAPGSYRAVAQILASAPGSTTGNGTSWANADFSVNGEDMTGLQLTAQPGLTVSGRLSLDSHDLQPPDPARVQIQLLGVRSGSLTSVRQSERIRADGTFTVGGLLPGRYFIRALLTANGAATATDWVTRSALIGGRDAADVPIDLAQGTNLAGVDITLTDRPGEISGTLLDAAGRPAPDYFVVVFPTEREYWLENSRRIMRPIRPAANGRYRFAPLPAGSYYLAALTDVDQEDLYDRSFLELIAASAIRLTLADGEKKVQDVRLAGR